MSPGCEKVFFFCNRIVNVWNRLPSHVVAAQSLHIFKNYLCAVDFSEIKNILLYLGFNNFLKWGC